MPEPDLLLRTGQLAARWHVSPKTVTRYAREAGLPFVLTPGGHRRYSLRQAEAWRDEHLEASLVRNELAGANPGWRRPQDDPGPGPSLSPTASVPGSLDGAGRT